MNIKPTQTVVSIGLAIILATVIGFFGSFILSGAQPSSASTSHVLAPLELALVEFATGFNNPISLANAGPGDDRLFVVEQGGVIKIVQPDGVVLPTPFLDIDARVDSSSNEEGLLGLAFHPNYASNGYFYVNYTNTTGGVRRTRISRFRVTANPNIADPNSEDILLTVTQPNSNHNAGDIHFGPDGYLYIPLGDGGGGGDTSNNAQNMGLLLGKIVRIDVNSGPGSPPDCRGVGSGNYTIPATNPLRDGTGGTCDEIWAVGLRNPWRSSFDRLTGDFYLGDVGQGSWEEVDFQPAGSTGGENYGWRCYEGNHDFNTSGCSPRENYTFPIFEYDSTGNCSVIGGYVYRGSQYSAMVGHYLLTDYCTGNFWDIVPDGGGGWQVTPHTNLAAFGYVAFGEDASGELYVVNISNDSIFRLIDTNSPPSPNIGTSTKSVSTPHADPGEIVTYTIQIKNTGGPTGQTAYLTDTLPSGLNYISDSLTATQGMVNDSTPPLLFWQGQLNTDETITVTYQVTPSNVTGSLVNQAQLTGPGFEPVTLSAAVFVPRPVLTTTLDDFFLPGTQPNQLVDNIADPNSCDSCHTAPIYDKWRGSMMSQAGRDPLLWAALAVANADAPGAGDYCLRCHTPKGWLEGRSHPGDGSALQNDDITAGVACEVCHRMVDPIASTSDEAVAIDAAVRSALTSTVPANHPSSAMLIVDPEDNRRGPFAFDPDPLHPKLTLKTDFLGQGNNALTEARLCGTCHNVDNPVLSWDSGRNQFWPNETNLAAPSFDQGELFPIETTFDEWANSEYAASGVVAPQFAGSKPDGLVSSCQDCHLRRTTGKAAEDSHNPVTRDCSSTGCLPEHDLVGGNTWVPQILQDTRWRLNSSGESAYLSATIIRAREMLQKAATLTVTLTTSGANKVATVRVINETGHKLPTGYPEGRRIWLNLKAYDDDNNLIYESGIYDSATGILTEDPDAKIYEAKQGLTEELATFLGFPQSGATFHFVLNNMVIKDNRIPPRGYTQGAFDQSGLRPVGATFTDGQYWDDTTYILPADTQRVLATLYYQTASKEYIDFLRTNGGVDGVTLGELWDSSKSPPEVMAVAFFPSLPTYLPLIFK